jgi:hypothetical protein
LGSNTPHNSQLGERREAFRDVPRRVQAVALCSARDIPSEEADLCGHG